MEIAQHTVDQRAPGLLDEMKRPSKLHLREDAEGGVAAIFFPSMVAIGEGDVWGTVTVSPAPSAPGLSSISYDEPKNAHSSKLSVV